MGERISLACKDRDGIYYKSPLHRKLGIASPSLNFANGGMNAIHKKAMKRIFNEAKTVEKWEIRRARRTGKTIFYTGTHEANERYAIYYDPETDKHYKTIRKDKL